MKNWKFLYLILAISITVFAFLVVFWTVIPSTGTIELPGGVYTGELKGRTFHGEGIWKSDFGPIYEGDFLNGVFHGHGTMTFTNGATYSGAFKDGFMHGYGIMTFADGHTHEGFWETDKFLGDHSDCEHDH